MYLHVPDYHGVLQGFWVWNGHGWIYSLIIKCMIIVWGFEMVMVGYIRLRWLTLLAGCKAFRHKCWELWCCRISWSLDAKMFGGHAVFQAHLPPMDNPSLGPAPGNPASKWNGPSTPEWVFSASAWKRRASSRQSSCQIWLSWDARVDAQAFASQNPGGNAAGDWNGRCGAASGFTKCSAPHGSRGSPICPDGAWCGSHGATRGWVAAPPSIIGDGWLACHRRSLRNPYGNWSHRSCDAGAEASRSASRTAWPGSDTSQETACWIARAFPILNGLAKQGAQSTCEARTCWNCVFSFPLFSEVTWHAVRMFFGMAHSWN